MRLIKPNVHHATNGDLIRQSILAVRCRFPMVKPVGRTRRFIVLFHGVKQNMAERVLLSIKVPPPILCSHSQAEVPSQNFRSLPIKPCATTV
jgi:competence transcription factor ComK